MKIFYKIIFIIMTLFLSSACVDLDGSIDSDDEEVVNLDGTWEISSDEVWDGSQYITTSYPAAYTTGSPLEEGQVKAYVKIEDKTLKYYKKIENVIEVEGDPLINGLFRYSEFTSSFTLNEEGVITTSYNDSSVTGSYQLNGAECLYTLTIDEEEHTFKRKMIQIYEFSFDDASVL